MPQRHVEAETHYLTVVSRARRDAGLGVYRSVGPDQDIYQHAHRLARRELAIGTRRARVTPPQLQQG